VPDHLYLDTSAVLRWAFLIGGSPLPRDAEGHATFEALVASDALIALTPITLIEVASNLNRKIRSADDWYARFGAAEAEAAQTSLMRLLGSGRLEGRNLGPALSRWR
jgi:hypothetical protein